MPLVRNTETGNNFLEKINTGGDVCSKTAVRSYDKQLGVDGIAYPTGGDFALTPPAGVPAAGEPENYYFSLPFYYVPDTYTLWVFVNGQKAEYMATGGDHTIQKLEYMEPASNTVLFYYPLQDDDVIEFIVVGAYDGEVGDALIPDLSSYKTVDASNLFTSNQPMSTYKFTGLGYGTAAGDSVRKDQLGPNFYNNVHFHTELHDSTGNNPIVQTSTGLASVSSTLQIDTTIPVFNMLSSANDGQWTVSSNLLSMNYRVGTGAWNTVATWGLDSNKYVNFYGRLSMNNNKITNVADGIISSTSTDAIAAKQLVTSSAKSIPTTQRWMPVNIISKYVAGGVTDGGGANYYVENLATKFGWGPTSTPAWARGIIVRVRSEIDSNGVGLPHTGAYGCEVRLPYWDTTGLMTPPYVKGAVGLQEDRVLLHGNASDTYNSAFTDTTTNDVFVHPFNDEWWMFYYWYIMYSPSGIAVSLDIEFIGFYR